MSEEMDVMVLEVASKLLAMTTKELYAMLEDMRREGVSEAVKDIIKIAIEAKEEEG